MSGNNDKEGKAKTVAELSKQLRQQREEFKKKIAGLKSQLGHDEGLIEDLKNELEADKKLIKKLEGRLDVDKNSIKKLKGRLDVDEGKLNDLNNSVLLDRSSNSNHYERLKGIDAKISSWEQMKDHPEEYTTKMYNTLMGSLTDTNHSVDNYLSITSMQLTFSISIVSALAGALLAFYSKKKKDLMEEAIAEARGTILKESIPEAKASINDYIKKESSKEVRSFYTHEVSRRFDYESGFLNPENIEDQILDVLKRLGLYPPPSDGSGGEVKKESVDV